MLPALAISMILTVPLLAADASGTWVFTSDVLPRDLTCAFIAKDAKLSGTCSAGKTQLPIAEGQITGNTVQWTVNVPSDTGITTAYAFVGELDEKAMTLTGSITISTVIGTEKGTFTAQRR